MTYIRRETALRVYTSGVLAARHEYALHPFAACHRAGCGDLARDGDILCRVHRRDSDGAMARQKKVAA